jgi:hypothetical protein
MVSHVDCIYYSSHSFKTSWWNGPKGGMHWVLFHLHSRVLCVVCSNLSHTHSQVTPVSHSVGVLRYYSSQLFCLVVSNHSVWCPKMFVYYGPELFKTSWWNRPKGGPLCPLQSWLLCVPTCIVLLCSVP